MYLPKSFEIVAKALFMSVSNLIGHESTCKILNQGQLKKVLKNFEKTISKITFGESYPTLSDISFRQR